MAVANPRVVAYFPEWGVYERGYDVKDVETSGAADQLTHLLYAFGNVVDARWPGPASGASAGRSPGS